MAIAAPIQNPLRRPKRTARPRGMATNLAPIDAAFDLGHRARLMPTMATTLHLGSGASVTLVTPHGEVSPAGLRYYERMGVAPPTTSAYEQPLIDGKWAIDREGKRQAVRRMVNGVWQVTKKGEAYFRYNQDTFEVLYLSLIHI